MEWSKLIDKLTKREGRFDGRQTPEETAPSSNHPAHQATEEPTFNEAQKYDSSSIMSLCAGQPVLSEVPTESMIPKTQAASMQFEHFTVEVRLNISLYNKACVDYSSVFVFGSTS